jgi:hypothetical protein
MSSRIRLAGLTLNRLNVDTVEISERAETIASQHTEGSAFLWQSNGTNTDTQDGDVVASITSNSATRVTTFCPIQKFTQNNYNSETTITASNSTFVTIRTLSIVRGTWLIQYSATSKSSSNRTVFFEVTANGTKIEGSKVCYFAASARDNPIFRSFIYTATGDTTLVWRFNINSSSSNTGQIRQALTSAIAGPDATAHFIAVRVD